MNMTFDVRFGKYVFKHSITEKPSLDREQFKDHYHSLYELLFFIKGDAEFTIQSKKYSLKSGDLLVVQPGEHHNVILRSDAPYERVVIRFDPISIHPQLRQYLSELENVYYIKGTPLSTEINSLDMHFDKVRKEMVPQTFVSTLNIVLSYLTSSPELIQKADLIDKDIKEIIDFIDLHLSEIQSIESISEGLHMSKSTIYKTFGKYFDTPIMSYIRTQKIMVGKTMLNDGIPATEVASLLGFNHYSSFYRDYCNVFNEPPSGKDHK